MSIGFITKELYCQDGDKKIYCLIRKPSPSSQGKLPTVIFSHGFGVTNTAQSVLQDCLAQMGIVVVSFDFCGGQSDGEGKSDGSIRDMTVFTEKANLLAVIEMTKALPFVDSSRLFLAGESQGGFVTAITAASLHEEVCGAFLLYPAFTIPDNTRKWFGSKGQIPASYDLFGTTVYAKYFEAVIDFDVYKQLPMIHRPVHIFHGQRDSVVPLEASLHAISYIPDCILTVFPEEGHGFEARAQRKTAELIAAEVLHSEY